MELQPLHKFRQEVRHLEQMLPADPRDEIPADSIDMVLAQAKRVRVAGTLLVRALARHRDHATGQEATST